jgi:putative DNA-invertase from lambdoid prophage Rac
LDRSILAESLIAYVSDGGPVENASQIWRGSGATTRPLREKLIETARRREIDSVIVWRLDRWGRSLVDLVNTLQELTALDVGFVSLSEALDLTTPGGRAGF